MRAVGPAMLALAMMAGASRADEAPALLQLLRQRAAVRHTDVPRKVLAFYYPWYGTPEVTGRWAHWNGVDLERRDIASSTHFPVGGPYDSHDPTVIDRHIEQAQAAGIDGFICSWWGQGEFTDAALALLLERAEGTGLQVTVYWESVGSEGEEQIRRAVSDLQYLVENRASSPAFLKVDGRPAIFVYGRVLRQVPADAWPAILAGVRQRVETPPLLIADGYRADYARIFDGVHTYNICGWVAGRTPEEIAEEAQDRYAAAVEMARRQRRISCLTVIPGYDDTKIREPGVNAERHDGRTYAALWEQAIAAAPDWVLITSWNEWHEGSEIEPSVEYGEMYLEATRRATAQFGAAPPPEPASYALLGPTQQQQEVLSALYTDTSIGLLPGCASEVLLALADSGLEVQELSLDDVVDPRALTPEHVPVLVYGAGERYARTVREDGDVDRALLRYLREGGVLLVAAHRPLPFYYDSDGTVVNAAQRLGLPVLGSTGDRDLLRSPTPMGWERPPQVEDLHFELDTEALPGLPERAAFPDTGDLRWRPATETLLADGDVYVPLASLSDAEGRDFGEGIAWIEHHQSEPRGGRLLYCWMRMHEVAAPGDLYFALLRFVGERLEE